MLFEISKRIPKKRTLFWFFFCSFNSFDRYDKILPCLKNFVRNPRTYRHRIVRLFIAQLGLIMCNYFSMDLKRQSELPGLCPDTSSLIVLLVSFHKAGKFSSALFFNIDYKNWAWTSRSSLQQTLIFNRKKLVRKAPGVLRFSKWTLGKICFFLVFRTAVPKIFTSQ